MNYINTYLSHVREMKATAHKRFQQAKETLDDIKKMGRSPQL
jgi:hypothetical protein